MPGFFDHPIRPIEVWQFIGGLGGKPVDHSHGQQSGNPFVKPYVFHLNENQKAIATNDDGFNSKNFRLNILQTDRHCSAPIAQVNALDDNRPAA